MHTHLHMYKACYKWSRLASHLFPVPVPHARVAQTLDQRDVRFEVLNLVFDLLCNIFERRDILEVLDTLVDGLKGSIHVGTAKIEKCRSVGVWKKGEMWKTTGWVHRLTAALPLWDTAASTILLETPWHILQ